MLMHADRTYIFSAWNGAEVGSLTRLQTSNPHLHEQNSTFLLSWGLCKTQKWELRLTLKGKTQKEVLKYKPNLWFLWPKAKFHTLRGKRK